MEQFDEKGKGNTLKIKDWGFFLSVDDQANPELKLSQLNEGNSTMFNYIVMPRLGMNINQLIELRAANFNKA